MSVDFFLGHDITSVEIFQRQTKYKWHFSFLNKNNNFYFLKKFVDIFCKSKKKKNHTCRKRCLNAQNIIIYSEKKSVNFTMATKKSTKKTQRKKLGISKSWFLQYPETSKNMFKQEN